MRLPFYRYILKLSRLPGISIRKKIIASFTAIFALMLPLVVSQIVTGMRQTSEYRKMIDNIGMASGLSTTIKTEIEPIVWDIVAGKTRFESSGIGDLMADIRGRMEELKLDHYSRRNRTMMEVVLRTMSTLESYIGKLELQINEELPVAEHEATLEEIRAVANLIADLMQNFIGRQMNEIQILNERISGRSGKIFFADITLLAIVVTIGFFTVWTISGDIARPIEKLRIMASKIASGDFHSRVSLHRDGELSELADSMNSMAKQIELLIQKSIEEERNLKMSEMKTLQAQITPHFLYNTLDAVIWAAESNRSGDVIKLVTALSSFFRITLSHGVDFIPLRNEIQHVENYLIIQQMRYSDILRYSIDVDPGIMDDVMLKILLQPLVENAIYHGIRHRRGGRGLVTVTARGTPDGLSFCVSDTGVGMTDEKISSVRSIMKEGPSKDPSAKGYGLFNVNRRLELYYGPEYGLDISSGTDGTSVSFVLPKGRAAPAQG
ncbi:MAG: sensor histidine kinase [Synergistaceae bacterium]|jgi:two-component system sensor histidine kinase YesM|nr:sensor histidine kinase [Synergistaceae bacterium]